MRLTQINLLKKHGIAIRGLSGQHFLIDPNIQRKIVELLAPKKNEWILEIGPGLGALTAQILAARSRVVAIEKDKRFCEILEEELGEEYKGKLRIENADVLKTDLKKWFKKKSVKVVSNLPYYITSPILFWLIENRSFIDRAVLMMQREVADRLLAQPGEKDYSRLTLGVGYYALVQRAFHVSRNCFTPKPEVDSTVLTLDFYPSSKLPKGIDEEFLFRVIQIAFGARRKTLLSRLAHDPQIKRSRTELLDLLNRLGISKTARAEDLLLKDFLALAASLAPR